MRLRRQQWEALLAGSIVVSAALVWVASAAPQSPVARANFSGELTTRGSTPCGNGCNVLVHKQVLPAGKKVAIVWHDLSGGSVEFTWGHGSGPWERCGTSGAAGSCAFWSVGGEYVFSAIDAVNGQSVQVVQYSGFY